MSKRAIVIASLAVLLAAVGTGVFLWLRPSKQSDLHFTTVPLGKGRITAKVTATGTLSALVTVQIGSQVSGRIKSLHADFNSEVKKGELLATLDPQFFEAALEQARANADAAKGDLSAAKIRAMDAERQYKRAKSLAERSLIAQAELDTAKVTMLAARAAVVSAEGKLAQNRAQLHQAQVNLAYTKVYSPIDGVVISRNVDVGQTVAASLSAPTLYVLGEDLRKMQIDTSVSETDIGKLRAGMPAIFTVGAFPGERFTGTVRQIRNAPQTVLNVVSYDAVIDVVNPELKLRPGMTATVTFIYAEKDDVLRVPNAALRFRPPTEMLDTLAAGVGAKPGGAEAQGGSGGEGGDGKVQKASFGSKKEKGDKGSGGERRVWVLADGQPRPVPVTVGITDGSLTEVASDRLHEGDQVIVDVVSEEDASSGRRPPGDAPKAVRKIF